MSDNYKETDRDNNNNDVINLIAKNLCEKDNINRLLNIIGWSQLISSRVISTSTKHERCIIDIEIVNDDSIHPRLIHIDAVVGAPSLEQVADCVYGKRTDSDLRIILYEEDYDEGRNGCAPGTLNLTADLVAQAITNEIPTILVHASSLIRPRINFDINEYTIDICQTKKRGFPSRKQILEAEFWSLYYHTHWACQGAGYVFDIDSAMGEWSPGYQLGDKRTKAEWNDDGLFFGIEGRPDADDMKWLTENTHLFGKHYPDCPVKIEFGDELAIMVRVLDIPMKELIELTPGDKWNYGEYLYGEEHRFVEITEEVFNQHENKNIQNTGKTALLTN